MQRRDIRFEIKAVGEDGTFEGLLSPYGNVDLGGDVVEPGAFTKTLQESKGSVPLLWYHQPDHPIGMLDISDSPEGLRCKGTLALEVPKAQEVYALLKRRIVKGLSIGFQTIKDSVESGVRHLKELRLFEGSVVTFPMNLQAIVSSVKSAGLEAKADDFATKLAQIQLYAARWQMLSAICGSLDDIVYDYEMPAEDKIAASQQSIEQFMAAYMEFLPVYLGVGAAKSLPGIETKAGRMLSEANRSTIQQCIEDLKALLDAAGAAEGAAKSAKSEPASATQTKAASIEPAIDHSALEQFIQAMRS